MYIFYIFYIFTYLHITRNKKATGFNLDEEKAMNNVDVDNSLECKICVNTYKMLFVTKVGRSLTSQTI